MKGKYIENYFKKTWQIDKTHGPTNRSASRWILTNQVFDFHMKNEGMSVTHRLFLRKTGLYQIIFYNDPRYNKDETNTNKYVIAKTFPMEKILQMCSMLCLKHTV